MTLSILRRRPDFWTGITIGIIAMLAILLILPILRVLLLSFVDADTGAFTLGNYVEVFTRNYYVNGLKNTMFVGILGTLGACLLGIPLAFFTARFHIFGRAWISTLAILVLVAPPFIGAYAWIMMLGANGFITNFFEAFGIDLPSIYGAQGIILVFTLKFFPFVFLMTQTALNAVNKSFEDAAENLGCTPWQRFTRITLPLVFPAVSTGAIICFVLAIADFGTPAILGRGFRTLSTIAFAAYRSELGGLPTMAVTVSIIMMAISPAVCQQPDEPAGAQAPDGVAQRRGSCVLPRHGADRDASDAGGCLYVVPQDERAGFRGRLRVRKLHAHLAHDAGRHRQQLCLRAGGGCADHGVLGADQLCDRAARDRGLGRDRFPDDGALSRARRRDGHRLRHHVPDRRVRVPGHGDAAGPDLFHPTAALWRTLDHVEPAPDQAVDGRGGDQSGRTAARGVPEGDDSADPAGADRRVADGVHHGDQRIVEHADPV
jgi:ABC-type spermidine/putrescine transport system permease subunit I